MKSHAFPNLPKKFQDKSDRKKMDKYCRFLLGAYKECMAKYVDLKLGKVHENKENPYKQKKPSTTSSYTPASVISIDDKPKGPSQKMY